MLGYIYGMALLCEKDFSSAKFRRHQNQELTPEQEDKLRMIIEKEYKTEGDLRRDVMANIKRLKDIKAYRGIRHMKHLPTRGQRTKTNSRTVRGNVRKTMGSGRVKEGLKT